MEDLLKRKKVIKGKVTRLINLIDGLNTESISLPELEINLENLNSLIECTNGIFDEILVTCDDTEYDKYEEESHEILDRLNASKIKMRTMRLQFNSNLGTANLQTNANIFGHNVNLPKLNLPSYSGNVTEWISFCDLFTASIHDNKNLSDAQKLQYLKLSLKGDAAFLIQSIQISDNNYQKAWEILKDRYENNSEIISATLDRLFSQQNVTHEISQGLRRLIDTTTQCLDTLKILKQPVEHWDAIIIHFLKRN